MVGVGNVHQVVEHIGHGCTLQVTAISWATLTFLIVHVIIGEQLDSTGKTPLERRILRLESALQRIETVADHHRNDSELMREILNVARRALEKNR